MPPSTMPSHGLFLIPAVVGQLIPMLLCLTVFVEVTIVRRCIVTLVASTLSRLACLFQWVKLQNKVRALICRREMQTRNNSSGIN